MPVREATAPSGPLYRVARPPEPLAWPDWQYVGNERFDDPERTYRVLYTAEEPRACFVEALAPWRPGIAALVRLQALPPGERGDRTPPFGRVAADWCAHRLLGSCRVTPGQRWLDLRSPATLATLRVELAAQFQPLGLDDFDMSDALSRKREVSRTISRWTFAQGFQGIAYASRFDAALTCWALFEGAQFQIQPSRPITAADPDFRAALALHGLALA